MNHSVLWSAAATLYVAHGGQDVDQRLTRDIERLCNDLSALIPSMVKPVVDILWCGPRVVCSRVYRLTSGAVSSARCLCEAGVTDPLLGALHGLTCAVLSSSRF